METAALVVSIVAIAIAVASAWYTRGNKVNSDRLLEIEQARRTDEEATAEDRLVDFTLVYDNLHDWMLTNTGPATAYHVEVQTSPGGDRGPTEIGEFAPGQKVLYHLPHGHPMHIRWCLRPDRSDRQRHRTISRPRLGHGR